MKSKKYSVMRGNVILAWIIEMGSAVLLYLVLSTSNSNPTTTPFVIIGFTTFNVLSLAMLIYFIITFGGTVQFSETGIEKRLLWCLYRRINWSEIAEVVILSLPRGSYFVFFSTVVITYNRKFTDIDRLRHSKTNIFINLSFINPNQGAMHDFYQFAPADITNKIKHYHD